MTTCLSLASSSSDAPAAASSPERLGQADKPREMLDVLDASGRVLSRASRAVVHAEGLRHRAVHVLLLRRGAAKLTATAAAAAKAPAKNVDLLLARRSPRKRLGPGLWDISVAEHVAAGEEVRAAACRGLAEELGLHIPPNRIVPVAVDVPKHFIYEEEMVHDNELVSLFVADYRGPKEDGPITPDHIEVVETAWFPLKIVAHLTTNKSHLFTPWMLDQLASVNVQSLAKDTLARR